jgi:iron(II)-dependent oxidoreductase
MRLLAFLLLACTLPACAALTVTLSATPPSTGAVGQRIVLVAAVTGAAKPQYHFEVTTTGGTPAYTRDYTTGRSTWWYPTAEGAYTVTARAKDGANGAPASATMSYSVNAKLSAVTLAATVGAVTAVNTRITFTATATGGGTVEYRPLIGYRAGTTGAIAWDQTRQYSTGRATTFTPDKLGSYFLRVYAREKGSTKYYDVTSPDLPLAVRTAVTGFDAAVAPSSGAKTGTPVSITAANPVGGGTLEWKAWAKLKSATTWTLVRDFAASPRIAWTPLVPGVYDLMVYAREAGKTSVAYDVRKAGLTCTVTAPQAGDTYTNPVDGATMVWVPRGTFPMGSLPVFDSPVDFQFAGERPLHDVTLRGFWVQKYEVTVAQYRAFCASTNRPLPLAPYNQGSWAGKTGWDDPTMQQHPIFHVTWDDAHDYAAWAGLCLPTEAQWEYVARGTEGRNYPWGGLAIRENPSDGWDSTRCPNWRNPLCTYTTTWTVGSFPAGASWCGALDMAGNVAEYCADWYGWTYYGVSPALNPVGPATGNYRIIRGISLGNVANFTHAFRGATRAFDATIGQATGFRCVTPPLTTWAASVTVSAVPGASVSVVVKATDAGDFSTSRTVNAPAAGGTVTVTLDGLPEGLVTFTATAYPSASGQGVAQAIGTTEVLGMGGDYTNTPLSMQSTIRSIVVRSAVPSLAVDATSQMTATALDADGQVVTVAPGAFTWSTGDSGIASITPTGLVTRHTGSAVTITATETASGMSGTHRFSRYLAAGTPSRNDIDGADMVWVPDGAFTRGVVAEMFNDSFGPPRTITMTGFWMYTHEVTVAQYRLFCEQMNRPLPPFPTEGYTWAGKTGWDDPALQQHPIVNVSWENARQYAAWAEASLPSEAQWEYAARGPQDNNYPWGGVITLDDEYNGWDANKYANYDNSMTVGVSTWPVESFPADVSWCGVRGMGGNVDEFCEDLYAETYYSLSPDVNPVCTEYPRFIDEILGFVCIRGGSWAAQMGMGSNEMPYVVCKFRPHTWNRAGWDGRAGLATGFRCVYVPTE